MKIIRIDSNNPDKNFIQKAADILRSDGLVIYPTDTAYGLGGNAFKASVIQRVYEVKGRDLSRPTHVIVKSWEMIEAIAFTSSLAKQLYESFLPGPLTLILPKKQNVPDILTAKLPTIGIRMPKCPVTQMLSTLLPFPYTTPSANRSGGKTPYSLKDVQTELDIKSIDLLLDAGELSMIAPSTIIDLTNEVPKILRLGPITKEQIESRLGISVSI